MIYSGPMYIHPAIMGRKSHYYMMSHYSSVITENIFYRYSISFQITYFKEVGQIEQWLKTNISASTQLSRFYQDNTVKKCSAYKEWLIFL